MGWESRGRGKRRYYTRSRWVDGRVIREYVGCGLLGEIAALEDEYKRRQREEEAAFWKEEKERLEAGAAFLDELAEVSEVLLRAQLLASGFHKHKGQWRRKRGS